MKEKRKLNINISARNKNLSQKEYLNKVKPYLRNIIIDFQEFDTWKINKQLQYILFLQKDAEEDREKA